MSYLFTALGTDERFSTGKYTAVRLQSFNETYTELVKWMKEQDKWRDQLGNPVTDITPEQSIQDHVKEFNTRTQETPISYQQTGVVKVVRNDLARFNSITGDNPPEPVSSEDEDTKTERLDTVLSKIYHFHQMYLYLYFHFGSDGVGDCDSPYFLETAEAIQQVVEAGDYSNRDDLRKK
jgi:hypothetical protein